MAERLVIRYSGNCVIEACPLQQTFGQLTSSMTIQRAREVCAENKLKKSTKSTNGMPEFLADIKPSSIYECAGSTAKTGVVSRCGGVIGFRQVT